MDANPILAEIEGFLAEVNMLPRTFGRLAMRDPRFVFDLRRGRATLNTTQDRCRAQIAHYRQLGVFLPAPTAA